LSKERDITHSSVPSHTRPAISARNLRNEDRVATALMYFRRGYSAIDAAGNAGISHAALCGVLTDADWQAHDAVWA